MAKMSALESSDEGVTRKPPNQANMAKKRPLDSPDECLSRKEKNQVNMFKESYECYGSKYNFFFSCINSKWVQILYVHVLTV